MKHTTLNTHDFMPILLTMEGSSLTVDRAGQNPILRGDGFACTVQMPEWAHLEIWTLPFTTENAWRPMSETNLPCLHAWIEQRKRAEHVLRCSLGGMTLSFDRLVIVDWTVDPQRLFLMSVAMAWLEKELTMPSRSHVHHSFPWLSPMFLFPDGSVTP